MQALEKFANSKNVSIWQAIPLAQEIVSKGAMNILSSFVQFIKTFIELKSSVSVKEIAEKVIINSGYLKDLEAEDLPQSRARVENIQELISAIDDFEKRSSDKSLVGYLTQISLISDIDALGQSNSRITLMTLHLAKGLEFDNVFICGLEEGLFPFESVLESCELQEERRLMYVGMTRARKRLYLCWSEERTVYGKTKWNIPSRFISEAGFKNDLIDYSQKFRRALNFRKSSKAVVNYVNGYNRDGAIKDEFLYASHEDLGEDLCQYKIGTIVLHPVFGKGKIIEKSGAGDDLKLIVLFENGQWKKLLAKVANLKFTSARFN
jgi:DNA helicase-2/ATP-dependent DNA helicase PcrA